jgi:ABC-type glycerol-3-phosphate transport system permease component
MCNQFFVCAFIVVKQLTMWNEFVFAYTLTQAVENRTLPLAVWEFQDKLV